MAGTKRTAGLLAIGVAAVLALGACGAGNDRPAPGALVSASLDKTTTGTARFSGDVLLQREDESVKIQSMEGESDFGTGRTSMTTQSPLSRFDPTQPDVYVDLISAGDVSYERIDGLDLPAGKEWVAISRSDLGLDGIDRTSLGSGDPADGLSFLAGVKNAREVGPEDVRGTPTTRYSVTMDLDKTLAALRKGAKELSPEFGRMLDVVRDKIDVRRLPGAVWLDGTGRVRRFRYSMTPPGKRPVSSVVDMEYFDFGAPVKIEAPPADETVPFAEAADAMRRFMSRGGAPLGGDSVDTGET